MKLESLALHHGYESESTTKAAAVPLYQTTSFTFDDTQHGADLFDLKVAGNIYTRIMNPTSSVLEQRVAAKEGRRLLIENCTHVNIILIILTFT